VYRQKTLTSMQLSDAALGISGGRTKLASAHSVGVLSPALCDRIDAQGMVGISQEIKVLPMGVFEAQRSENELDGVVVWVAVAVNAG
jgi:hypothetical protein